MRHDADKVIADLELLRDDALADGVPTSAMWLTCAIETILDLAQRAEAAEAALERVRTLAKALSIEAQKSNEELLPSPLHYIRWTLDRLRAALDPKEPQ